MTELLTAKQMRAIDLAAIESGDVTGLELMERAGQGVVEALTDEWLRRADKFWAGPGAGGASTTYSKDIVKEEYRRAVILCGPGNNGGDGFVVARLLHESNWLVDVYLYGDPEKLPTDARVNYERWTRMGQVLPMPSQYKGNQRADLLVDALFGTGLTRPLDDDLIASIQSFLPVKDAKGSSPLVCAVDIPSGISSDSGRLLPAAIKADLCVTFHTAKTGHYLGMGPEYSGSLKVASIGLEGSQAVPQSEKARLVGQPTVSLSKSAGTHKYTHGHALILSGPSGHTGAARLAARGALRIGAGLVTLGVPAEAQQEVASQITTIMMRQIGEARVLEEVLKDDRLNALCLGPGLGMERARELVPVALGPKRATVLDADALPAFADDPVALFSMLHDGCILTPHAGEFARLFPDIAEKLSDPAIGGPVYSKIDATREAAKRAGCTVLFKGPDTVIASPEGQCSISSAAYEREAPWLATAGSGDVLAGFITGLLARGIAPMKAAETAAWLHVECALDFGSGLIAEDIPEQLPSVFECLEI